MRFSSNFFFSGAFIDTSQIDAEIFSVIQFFLWWEFALRELRGLIGRRVQLLVGTCEFGIELINLFDLILQIHFWLEQTFFHEESFLAFTTCCIFF